MAGVRIDAAARHTPVAVFGPTSTATLGVDSSAFNAGSYPHGSRFAAVLNMAALTEGTLDAVLVQCATSGGSYVTFTGDQVGTFASQTSATGANVQVVSFIPAVGFPFVKVRLSETVSITTATGVSVEILTLSGGIA